MHSHPNHACDRNNSYRGSKSMRAPGEGTADIGVNAPGFRASARSIVEISPADIVRRRLANWGAIQGDRVTLTRRETFEYGFRAPRHLLIAYERGEREDGEK